MRLAAGIAMNNRPNEIVRLFLEGVKPIMAPFSDLVGLSRQATVMAYQFGDGFTNMITPTSGVLIVLGVAKIPYSKWVKWITPLMIILIVLGFLLLIPTIMMPLAGF